MNKYNGMKKAGDWEGRKVVTQRDMKNGAVFIPKGSIAIVRSVTAGSLTLHINPCECCGCAAFISRVSYFDVEEYEK